MKGYTTELSSFPLPLLILIIIILLTQGIWLFLDAKKRNAYPWLWGLWGLLSAPMPTVVYLLVVRKVWKYFKSKKDKS